MTICGSIILKFQLLEYRVTQSARHGLHKSTTHMSYFHSRLRSLQYNIMIYGFAYSLNHYIHHC